MDLGPRVSFPKHHGRPHLPILEVDASWADSDVPLLEGLSGTAAFILIKYHMIGDGIIFIFKSKGILIIQIIIMIS
ncbi:hypothetical protein QCA50_015851 [Cerrena zonata]|uniref:Uncharacterized protein n=1 Tax=Cerrena zonata TaxID=2478898 RepID=A0AAW0FN85_9APHY